MAGFFLTVLELISTNRILSCMKKILISFLSFLSLSLPVAAQEVIPQSKAEIEMSYAPLVRKVAPSVVNIYTKKVVTTVNPLVADPFFGQFFGRGYGMPQQRLESSLGSGVIVDPTGLVVTNSHVIKDAREITVMLSDGREFAATLKLNDPASDIALLRLDTKNEQLPSSPLQPSDTLEVGDLVLAIGNPFGVGQTVTSGIVSALARSSLSINDFNFFIQTDAAINPGNSGGPLVSMKGGIVGINSAIFSNSGGSLGIGFAIPSEMVATIIAAEKSGQTVNGQIIRPWVGVSVQDLNSEIASSLGLSNPSGALITGLHEESPALKAGLRVGDLITSVNGRRIHDASEIRFRFAMVPIGGSVKIGYDRKGEEGEADVEAIKPPDRPARMATLVKGRNPLAGATLANINPALEVELGLKGEDRGIVVAKVQKGSIASRLVSVGDIIVAINKTVLKSPTEAQNLLDSSTSQAIWALTIRSKGQERTIVVR